MDVWITGVKAGQSPDGTNAFGVRLSWAGDRGIGQIDITQQESDGQYWLSIDSELMSREFVKEVLNDLIDGGRLVDEPDA